MNRTIESIFKDIDVLGINGGYDVEQLLTPNDCRILKSEIERLNNIINELEDELENATNEDYEYNDYNRGVNNTINHILNRLKDLKEK